jgi:pSer/pThr/pTyr-binding forkhead associated (FHA) protein
MNPGSDRILAGVLIVDEFEMGRREVRINGDITRIGRDSDCEVNLDDGAISRRHAQILRRGERFFLSDLGSANGTFLNKQRLPPRVNQPLRNGDRVRVGRSELRFLKRYTPAISSPSSEIVANAGSPPGAASDSTQSSSLCLFRLAKLDAALIVAGADSPPERIPLGSDRVRIGRSPGGDIVLDDASVSMHHAEIVYNRDGFHVVDRDSEAGTFVNEMAVRLNRLVHRDVVRFGKVSALFLVHEEGTDPPEASFELRDHVLGLFPEREGGIQEAFRESRLQAVDFAEELVLRGVLSPEGWWAVARSAKAPSTQSRSRKRRFGLDWLFPSAKEDDSPEGQ